jgi:hypothetical protein
VWGADTLTWKWRDDEAATFSLNLFCAAVLLPIAVLQALEAWGFWQVFSALTLTLVWMLFVACVQRKQFAISLRAAFFGALMQMFCFVLALCCFALCCVLVIFLFFLFSSPKWGIDDWLMNIWLVSALATYFILTLPRPSVDSFFGALKTRFREKSLHRLE